MYNLRSIHSSLRRIISSSTYCYLRNIFCSLRQIVLSSTYWYLRVTYVECSVLYVGFLVPLRTVTYVHPTKCYLRGATYVIIYCSLRSLRTSSTYCYLRAAYEVLPT